VTLKVNILGQVHTLN